MHAAMVAPLFAPFRLGTLDLPNRIVMPPMGLHSAEGGIPGPDVAAYYARRAKGGVGLIMTEGTYIDHPVSGNSRGYMRMSSEASIAGWTEVVRQVHAAGGRIMPEIWHVGLVYLTEDLLSGKELVYDTALGMLGPSGEIMPGLKVAEDMTQRQIDEVIDAFARAAVNARRAGFDGVELHGAHGYLIDQFFWHAMNHRTDGYGGSMKNRARFGAEVIAEVRRRVGPDYPLVIRLSQWKMQDYDAKVARSPQEMEDWLTPLADAGVDAFDCSQRRFWEPEFAESPLNFAGWAKKITGKPAITVGSVGLDGEMLASLMEGRDAAPVSFERLMDMFGKGDFDLVGIGRSLIADPDWPIKVQAGRFDELIGFSTEILRQEGSQLNYIKEAQDA